MDAELDFERMSESDLTALIAGAQQQLTALRAKRAKQTLKEAKRLAAEVGYEVDFVKVGKGGRKGAQPVKVAGTRAPVAPKYRNPENPEETWTGRGRSPKWVQRLQAEGMTMDELAIDAAA